MRLKYYIIAIVPFIYLFVFQSCRKDVSIKYTQEVSDFSDIFESYWKEMNLNYVYWDNDPTDWDMIYQKYKNEFKLLDINNNSDMQRASELFRGITENLIDGHYFVDFKDKLSSLNDFSPAYERKIKSRNFHGPYPYLKTDIKYFDMNFHSGFDSTTIPGKLLFAISGTINNRILYFTCNEFYLFKSYNSASENGIKPVLNYFFKQVQNNLNEIKGIIIDVRNNPGGELSDLSFLMGRLTNEALHIGYTRYKNGNGRLDYTPWIKAVINPLQNNTPLSIPIIALTDNFSASLSETIAMSISTLKNGTVIGENTWGATGPITSYEVYNSGQFSIGKFIAITASSSMFKFIDNKSYEGVGFPPDINIPFNREALNSGIDLQLEKAIEILR